jgi:hypothetical protein
MPPSEGDAFHQVAVADDPIGVVIDDLEARPVVACGEMCLGHRDANAVAETLAERTGCGFDAGCQATFRDDPA